jgi:biotin carboxyl carrier protein
MRLNASVGGINYDLEVIKRDGAFECRLNGRTIVVDVAVISGERLSILHEGKSYEVRCTTDSAIVIGANRYGVSLTDARSWRATHQKRGTPVGPEKITASMPGKVVRVLASPGTKIKAGQGIVVIEAMKMQNELRAPRDATVTSILVHEGKAVNAGEVLAVIE